MCFTSRDWKTLQLTSESNSCRAFLGHASQRGQDVVGAHFPRILNSSESEMITILFVWGKSESRAQNESESGGKDWLGSGQIVTDTICGS